MYTDNELITSIIDTAGALFVVINKDGYIVQFNQTCEQKTGYKLDELIDKPFWETLIIPEERQAVREVFNTLLAHHYPNHYENFWVGKSGELRLISWTNSAIVNNSGEVEFTVSIGIDVTEQRASEKKLKDHEKLYERLFHDHHAPHLLVDPETGEIVDANEAAGVYYGYTLDELKKINICALNTCRDDVTMQRLQRALRKRSNKIQVYHHMKNGELRNVEIYSSPIDLDDKILLYEIVHDVTDRVQAEERARQLSKFPEENPNPVMRISREGRLMYANNASAIILKVWNVRIGDEIPADWQEHIMDCYEANKLRELEIEANDKIFSCILTPLIEDGYVNLYGREITLRVKAERELELLFSQLETERNRWKATVDCMLSPVTVADAQGRATYMNAVYRELAQSTIDQDQQELPLLEASLHGKDYRNKELIQIDEIGKKRHFLWNASSIQDAAGNLVGSVAVGHEITDRVQAEQQSENHLKHLNILLETSKKIIAERTVHGLLKRTAEAARAITQAKVAFCGYGFQNGVFSCESDQPTENTWTPPAGNFTISRGGVYLDILEAGKTLRLTDEELISHPSWWGLPEWHIPLRGMLGTPILGSNGSGSGLLMVSDKVEGEFTAEDETLIEHLAALASLAMYHIEARRSAERRADELRTAFTRLEKANKEIQDFVFIASHDLQEPIRKVKAFSGMLQKSNADRLDEESQDYINRLNDAARRMQQMVEQLLSYSRVTTRARPFVLTNLEDILSEVLTDLKIQVARSKARIEIGPLPSAEVDREQIHQLFSNLIGNSLKFQSPTSTPMIIITGKRNGPADLSLESCIEILISDNGIGFDSRFSEKIFQPFTRLVGKNEYEGTGMGLAICRKIVERHNGTITASSQPGVGTTVVIHLPVNHSM